MKNPLKLRMRFSGSGSATGRASSPGGSKMPKSYWFAGSSEAEDKAFKPLYKYAQHIYHRTETEHIYYR